jgi:hypothetical protein
MLSFVPPCYLALFSFVMAANADNNSVVLVLNLFVLSFCTPQPSA